MALVVQKYGGTSLAGLDRIQSIADRIHQRRSSGDQLIVIVSAMGQTTDELLSLIHI